MESATTTPSQQQQLHHSLTWGGAANAAQHSYSQSYSHGSATITGGGGQTTTAVMSHNFASQNFNGLSSQSLYPNSKDNVKVVIRMRPLNERELGSGGHKKCVSVEDDCGISIEGYKQFNFDYVANEDVQQSVIFEKIAQPIANCCLEGYNGSIFAYGQTGSGKTFTIQGPNQLINGEETIFGSRRHSSKQPTLMIEENQRGIMQRSFEYIFECLENEKSQAENSGDTYQFEFLIRCSYLEIYNEQIMDLLEPTSINLHIREDIKKGVYVEGLQEEVVLSAEDMIAIIQQGAKNRHVGSHSMNKESSRSHSVLTTIIETKSMKEGGGVWNIKTSRFHIIDLAGSERSKQTNAVGERLKEAGMINKSLSALGNVINSLVDISEGKSRHVHYRDSKLTFLLRDSLGGNSKTLIIANVSPSNTCHGETLSTLKFAQRAKLIKNKAVINEDSSGTISLLKGEIARLKKDLAENEKIMKALQSGNGDQLQECSRCKAMFDGIDNEEEGGVHDDDEMLISFDGDDKHQTNTVTESLNQSQRLKRKLKIHQKQEITTLRARVTHLESLLSANLDSLSTQQKYYESEVQKWQLQSKRMQQTVESYEKQSARDKMIIKFREERISKLELTSHGGATGSEEEENLRIIADLKKEVQLWKEAADHNTQAAKLYAEKSDLQNKLEALKQEFQQTPESLGAQIRSLTEFNESLNQYLKAYCEESKKELENELANAKIDCQEQLNEFNQRIADMTQSELDRQKFYSEKEDSYKFTISNLKQELIKLEKQFAGERSELIKLNNEVINQIKNESTVNKSEQERQLQQLRVEILEKEQLLEKARKDNHEMEKSLTQLRSDNGSQIQQNVQQVKELEKENEKLHEKVKSALALIESERDNHTDVLQIVEDRWDQKVRELEEQISEHCNERDILNEQRDQAMDQIQALKIEGESMQLEIIVRDQQIQEQQQILSEKEFLVSDLQVQNDGLEKSITNLRSKLKLLEIQSQQLQQESQHQKESLSQLYSSQISQIGEEKEQLLSNIIGLEQEIANLQDQIVNLQTDGETKIKQLEQQIQEKQKESEIMMEEFTKQLNEEREQLSKELQQSLLSSKHELDQLTRKYQEKEVQSKLIHEAETQNLAKQTQELTQQISNLKQEIMAISTEKQNLSQTIQSQSEGNANLQKMISDNQTNYQQQITTFQSKISHLESGQSQDQSKFTEYTVQISELQQQIEELNQIIESQQQSHTELEQNHELAIQELVIKNSQSLSTLELQIQAINDLKDQEIQQIQDEQNKIIVHFEEVINRLQSEKMLEDEDVMKNIEEERKAFQNEIESITIQYEQQIQEKEAEIEKSNNLFNIEKLDLQNQITKLQDSLNSQHKQYESLSKKNQELQQQLSVKQTELSQHNQHLQKLSTALSDSSTKLQNYHQETTRLAVKLDQSLAQNDQLLQEVESKQREMDQLNERLQQLEELLNIKDQELQNAVHHSNSKEQDLNSQIVTLNQQLEEAREVTDSKIQAINEQNSNSVCKLEQERDQLQNKLTLVENDNQAKTSNIKELNEQISQLQIEKSQVKAQIQAKMTEDHLEQRLHSAQKKQSIEIEDLKSQHQEDLTKLRQEVQSKDAQYSELSGQLQKVKKRNQEQEDMLKTCKDTIAMMRQKDTEFEKEVKDKYALMQEREEKMKRHVNESRDERDRLRQESESLKELVRLKDRQQEEWLNAEERDKQALERISRENKDIRGLMTKREFEMKEMAKMLKLYLEENTRLKKENEKLCRENDQLIGHKNPSQKIQHHVRIKEENNRLREENIKLQEELRRRIDIDMKGGSQHHSIFKQMDQQHSSNPQFETQAAMRLVDHIFSQPSLIKALGMMDDQSLHNGNLTDKVVKAMELITSLGDQCSQKESRIRELEREVRKLESLFSISEKERVMSQQQQREMIQSPQPMMLGQAPSQSNIMPAKSNSNGLFINKENFSNLQSLAQQQKQLQQRVVVGTIPPQGMPVKKETSAMTLNPQLPNKLQGHQVRGGSAKRLVNGAAAAFINASNSHQQSMNQLHK